MTAWTGDTPDDVTAGIITLQRRFPGALVWFGLHTFRWWALMPWATQWILLEAATPMELAVRMAEARTAEARGSAVPNGVIGPVRAW